jgi:hypothetical protein
MVQLGISSIDVSQGLWDREREVPGASRVLGLGISWK